MAELFPLAIVSPVLVACAYSDLRYMRIPNKLVLMLAVFFVITSPMLTLPEIGWRIAVSAIVFGISAIAFSLRMLGGGDVKMLAALLLFIPSTTLTTFGYIFSSSMLTGLLVSTTLQNAAWAESLGWASVKAKGRFPMGISIALAGVAHPLVVLAIQ